MKVIRVAPRGYCYGVVDAMVLAKQAADNPELPRPIYILGMIVHNQHVVDAFEQAGVITLDGANRLSLLDQIETGTVIFTAHGVSPTVKLRAKERGLHVIDATCPDVTKTHDLIREHVAEGFQVVYVGRKGHPEPEGAVGVAPNHVYLVENADDVADLKLDSEKILVTNQTTMSQWDTGALMSLVKDKYPHAVVYNEICMATQTRQQAVADQAKDADLCLVVGDPRSNNSNRLAQVAIEVAGTPAHRIADLTEIQLDWLEGVETVAVTAGASTPTAITKEVIYFLEQYDAEDGSTWSREGRVGIDRLLPSRRGLQ